MSESSYNVTKYKEDTKLVDLAREHLNNKNEVEIVDLAPIEVGNAPWFFSTDKDLKIIGVLTYNFLSGGSLFETEKQGQVSSGGQGTVMMWPMTTRGMVANTHVRRIHRKN